MSYLDYGMDHENDAINWMMFSHIDFHEDKTVAFGIVLSKLGLL